jgi:hypothetical protein
MPLLKEIKRATEPTYSLDGDIVVQPVVRTRKGSEFVSPATLAEVADYLVEHPGKPRCWPAAPKSVCRSTSSSPARATSCTWATWPN